MLKFDVITIFPEMFDGVINDSIVKRAQENIASQCCQIPVPSVTVY